MSDQYTTTNLSHASSGLRQTPPALYDTQAIQVPVYNSDTGFGSALLVMLVFVVVAILASVLTDFNTNSMSGGGDGATQMEVPANSATN